jgi:hypothetical protein
MNGQLPPIDSDLREQLARRSAGRLPDGLLAEVSTALDAVPATKARARWSRPIWHAPRLAAAGLGAALVAVLAVAFAFPALRGGPATSPAGYPSERALTTAELAALLAGPPLATNTTLVASVTIDARTDVCPMNSRPTVGVVEGMGSQVCVMGATLQARFSGANATGTFAFRYLAPGSLGLLGQITPASTSKLAFQMTEDWPLDGNTFLVEGWLLVLRFPTNDSAFCPGESPVPAGDPLDPNGSDPCIGGWLNQDASELPTRVPDGLSVPKQARNVEAAGMSQIDAIPGGVPVAGVYVVRTVTDRCGNALPQDNPGCAVWRVMARVADVSIPRPTVSPTAAPTAKATATAIAGYPADRALTTAELGRVLDSAKMTQYQILVADATIGPAPAGACAAIDTTQVAGFQAAVAGIVEGLDPPACVYAFPGDVPSGSPVVLRVLGPRELGYMATVTPASGRLAFTATDDWPEGYLLVDAWLDFDAADCGNASLPGFGGPQPLHPGDPSMCHAALSDSQPPVRPSSESASPGGTLDPSGPVPTPNSASPGVGIGTFSPIPTYPVPADGKSIDAAPYFEFPVRRMITGSVHGVFLVQYDPRCSDFNPTDCEAWQLLGAVDPIDLSAVSVATPATAPPATPIVPPSGSAASPLGLLGPGNRPLTEGEFATLWAADPAHLAGRIAIVKGPVPSGFSCWSAGAADAGISPPPCHIAILDGQIGADGHYWAVSVGTNGKLAVVGEIAVPTKGYLFTLDQFVKSAASAGDRFLIVDAWLDWANDCDTLPTEPPGTVCGYSLLTSDRVDWMHMRSLWPSGSKVVAQYVQPNGAYQLFGSKDFGQAVHGLYLVHGTTILARLDAAAPSPT